MSNLIYRVQILYNKAVDLSNTMKSPPNNLTDLLDGLAELHRDITGAYPSYEWPALTELKRWMKDLKGSWGEDAQFPVFYERIDLVRYLFEVGPDTIYLSIQNQEELQAILDYLELSHKVIYQWRAMRKAREWINKVSQIRGYSAPPSSTAVTITPSILADYPKTTGVRIQGCPELTITFFSEEEDKQTMAYLMQALEETLGNLTINYTLI